jgi:hypothetical protein
MLQPSADYSHALAFLYAAHNFFSNYVFDTSDRELDRALIRGGLINLEHAQRYPAIESKAKLIAPALAASLANPVSGSGGGGGGNSDWSPTFCFYCGSKEHDMYAHPKNSPIVRKCRECQHARAKIGPMKADCVVNWFARRQHLRSRKTQK